MSEVILNTVQKRKGAKNLCSTRDLVAKLFVAIFANNAFCDGGSGGAPKAGAMRA